MMAATQTEVRLKNTAGSAAAESQDVLRMAQDNVQNVSRQVLDATERFTRSFNLSKEDAERFAEQSRRNLDAVTRCGTVLGQGFQDASRHWFELGQRQFQRNLIAFNRLAQARTLQEFAAIQSEVVREGLEDLVKDGKGIAETSLKHAEEAGQIFSSENKPVAQAGTRPN
ncbi:phasin family protein [Methylobacterium gnaphalii]|uniref:Phasin domain-containing protein n=1 Tax=Methylobacterium gnaphalii TaxID=1010610 RepID=A0A512JK52_9HYPH|nr:phasin family protein [Methylobacterium gnaphalii]GEP10310.1 hypothetical protein MGN01_21550 [Methylobacterium gnaphalii]GJD70941.1 hypothetical protein MMMDOFMJ_3895 [Methylobacterium gnaphalii]GLS51617.1 hypothetical protein GCM10007885_44760 [Methylobacterium gnaphalii]